MFRGIFLRIALFFMLLNLSIMPNNKRRWYYPGKFWETSLDDQNLDDQKKYKELAFLNLVYKESHYVQHDAFKALEEYGSLSLQMHSHIAQIIAQRFTIEANYKRHASPSECRSIRYGKITVGGLVDELVLIMLDIQEQEEGNWKKIYKRTESVVDVTAPNTEIQSFKSFIQCDTDQSGNINFNYDIKE